MNSNELKKFPQVNKFFSLTYFSDFSKIEVNWDEFMTIHDNAMEFLRIQGKFQIILVNSKEFFEMPKNSRWVKKTLGWIKKKFNFNIIFAETRNVVESAKSSSLKKKFLVFQRMIKFKEDIISKFTIF